MRRHVGLEDLRVVEKTGPTITDFVSRPASVEDLVSVLVSLGAERGLLDAADNDHNLTELVVVVEREKAAGLVRSALGQEVLVWPLSGTP